MIGFLGRLGKGWELAKDSWYVLKLDKELLVFPLLSGIACLLVLASFALPLWGSGYADTLLQDDSQLGQEPVAYVIAFAFYFANYFVITFFNSALIACAIIRFNGGDPTLADGIKAASSRLPQIFGWSLLAATVGLTLKIIESRSEKVGRIVAALLGAAWTVATYFVVPVLVVEKLGPIQAFRRSVSIIRNTWGEAIGAEIGTGVIVFLGFLLVLGVGALGLLIGGPILAVPITVIGFVLVGLISAALDGIIVGALYVYASDGTPPQQFRSELLEHAFGR